MKGILLVNTGSPRTQSRKDVKWFIGAMLSDPQVMALPTLFRIILAKGIIAPLRASSSAAHYSLIWGDQSDESPLLGNTQRLAQKLERISSFPVEIAMRYGTPSPTEAFSKLLKKCPSLTEVVIVPLFPQYAQSSYQTVADYVQKSYDEGQYSFAIKILQPYYREDGYISALVRSLKEYVNKGFDYLVFSFHSLPLGHVKKGIEQGIDYDYVSHVNKTVQSVTERLGVDPLKVKLVYSSAMGKKWLAPDLDDTVSNLAKGGAKRLIVITAGFPADNLETLYDIGIIARQNFMNNGGKVFDFVPCLNDNDDWVEGLYQIIESV